MRFRAEVREKLAAISRRLDEQLDAEKEIERLVAQNKDLMDRLMSRNFETLMTYQPQEGDVPGGQLAALAADEDEQNAGEILDIEA